MNRAKTELPCFVPKTQLPTNPESVEVSGMSLLKAVLFQNMHQQVFHLVSRSNKKTKFTIVYKYTQETVYTHTHQETVS